MKGKIVTKRKVIDLILTGVVIFLAVSIIGLEYKSYYSDDNSPKYVASSAATNDKAKESKEKSTDKKDASKEKDAEKKEETKKDESENKAEANKAAESQQATKEQVEQQQQVAQQQAAAQQQQAQQVAQQQQAQQVAQQQQAVQQQQAQQAAQQQQQAAAPTSVGRVNINGNVSADRATYLNNVFSSMPGKLQNAFDTIGFKLEIGNYGQGWAGLFSSSRGYIYVDNSTSMDLTYVVSHELGHFVDLLGYNASSATEFQDIYNSERLNLAPRYSGNYNYYTSDIREYFAECFSQYLLNSGTLAANNPRSYEYVGRIYNNISSSSINQISSMLHRAWGR